MLPNNKKMPYWINVLVAIDQLGNALTGGSPDNTISAKVGYLAANEPESQRKGYWKMLEKFIDFAFAPIQGPGHCLQASMVETDKADTPSVDFLVWFILANFLALSFGIIGIFIHLAVFFNPSLGFKDGTLRYDLWRQSRQAIQLAGDSTTNAPPPDTKNKKKK